MPNPDAERDPFLSPDETADPAPTLLACSVNEATLGVINSRLQARDGISIYELAETNPRYAYAELKGLFRDRFIDWEAENWEIGSPGEDGQMAFDGLTRYMKEMTTPDPDLEEVEVVISVWKRKSWFKRQLSDKPHTREEVMRFEVGPQDLAF